MKRPLFFLYLLCSGLLHLTSQVVTSDPFFATDNQAAVIYFDATRGNAGLEGYTGDVYAHTGVITDKSTSGTDWKYVKTDWGENTPETKLTRLSADLYSLELNPSIREYYGVPGQEEITHLAFVFRSASTAETGRDEGGKDILVELYRGGFQLVIQQPEQPAVIEPSTGLPFSAVVTEPVDFSLFLNGNPVLNETGTGLTHTFTLDNPGDYWIRVTASATDTTASDSVFVHVLDDQPTGPVPENAQDGISYLSDHEALLVLRAPGKEHIFAVGEFDDWIPSSQSRMVRDGDRFWITLDNLTPGKEYAFQYLVDGEVAVADPYTEKVLDPWNDQYITTSTYPDLKSFPSDHAHSPVSILQTGQPGYVWKHTGFPAPDPEDLVIYELLLRDFIQAHDWNTLVDSLDYFSRLGINAIELMPVNEFDGNESWGYNPTFYFAPDKYYGPSGDLKVFIDSCHGRGIAVILDMVLNHSYGPSPLVQLYLDPATNKVTPDNPWYNVESPNPVYSWGYDFNHESPYTKEFVDRVNRFWLQEYHVDGFRFDFTKGFTNTPGDGSAYDASRIAILERMADSIRAVKQDAYIILEHFTDLNEESELAVHGMMLWGNANYNYNEATMGYHEGGKSDFRWVSYLNRGLEDPRMVVYMESHDEERLMYKNLTYGNSAGAYDIQELPTSLARMELAGAFFFTIPGPKMLWQFGEVGYDYSIDFDCRVCNKPVRWDYYQVGLRRRLYQVWSALIRLKISEPAFKSRDFTLSVSGPGKWIGINHEDMDVRVLGNFDVEPLSLDPQFSRTGWWYDLFGLDSLLVNDVNDSILLQPGEYRIYTTKRLQDPGITAGISGRLRKVPELLVYPNPFSGMIHMEPPEENAVIRVYDLEGRKVHEAVLSAGQTHLDLGHLQAGWYLIQRISGESTIQYARILKSEGSTP